MLGSQNISAEYAEALVANQDDIIEMVGARPARLITSCRPVGAEKVARLAAKALTGKLAAVFHRAEVTYGPKVADMMANVLIAQEADALLILGTGNATCERVRARFEQNNKPVYEIEVG